MPRSMTSGRWGARWLSGETAGPSGAQGKEPTETDEVTDEVAAAVGVKLQQSEARVKELEDQLLRSYAERENIRKIGQNDAENAKKFAVRGFAKDILDVADNLERALLNVKQDSLEAIPELKALYDGLKLTHSGLIDIFKRHHITVIPALGAKFDPNIHQALFSFPDPSQAPDTVAQVLKQGYLLHDRVLRAADVGVIKAP